MTRLRILATLLVLCIAPAAHPEAGVSAGIAALATEADRVEQAFATRREALSSLATETRHWQQAVQALPEPGQSGEGADARYGELRAALRTHRQALDALLSADAKTTQTPRSLLNALPGAKAVGAADAHLLAQRDALATRLAKLAREEQQLLASEIATRLAVIHALNQARLELLPALSAAKRDNLTSLTAEAVDQASAEAWHLSLIARAHAAFLHGWLSGTASATAAQWLELLAATTPALLCVVIFLWVRRLTLPALTQIEARLAEHERRTGELQQGTVHRLVLLLLGILRPAEWLLFIQVLGAVVPTAVVQTLEYRVTEVILLWLFSVALAVQLLNTWVALGNAQYGLQVRRPGDGLRLRTLRYIGYYVVVVGVLRTLTAELVGRGTIYHWSAYVGWLALLPLVAWLVIAWQAEIFRRIGAAHRPNAVMAWASGQRSGPLQYIAALAGGVALLWEGARIRTRRLVDRFEVTRRIHAFISRQELDRLSKTSARPHRVPLAPATFAQLGPDLPSPRWQSTPVQAVFDEIVARAEHRRGGVIAVLGYRGMGKSNLFSQLASRVPGTLLIDCAGHDLHAQLEGACKSLPDGTQLVLVDDAHRLFRQTIGGLQPFDRLQARARQHASTITWVFALEQATWPFLQRSRDYLPLFDRVLPLRAWNERSIGELLLQRSDDAQVQPQFNDLLPAREVQVDPVFGAEELALRRDWFMRLLWDSARGNPGVALEIWRRSLHEDDAGTVHVRIDPGIESLDVLEKLPIEALFLLRSILQMEPVSADELDPVNRLPAGEIENLLQFGCQHGFLAATGQGYVISWRWLRAVRSLLERKHLMVVS